MLLFVVIVFAVLALSLGLMDASRKSTSAHERNQNHGRPNQDHRYTPAIVNTSPTLEILRMNELRPTIKVHPITAFRKSSRSDFIDIALAYTRSRFWIAAAFKTLCEKLFVSG